MFVEKEARLVFFCSCVHCLRGKEWSLFNFFLVYVSRFRWLIKTAMRPVGPFDSSPSFAQHNDCVLVVGVSRPKLAAAFLTIMIISLFLTFHVLYDSAIYSIQVSLNDHQVFKITENKTHTFLDLILWCENHVYISEMQIFMIFIITQHIKHVK